VWVTGKEIPVARLRKMMLEESMTKLKAGEISTLRYCPTSVRAELGWNAKGVVVSGKDESGHWANPRHPESD
jgi:hypothetical protein